jgi:hypothetical protein
MSFQVPPGILSFCQGQWDENAHKYISDNSANVIKCCLNTYKAPATRCYEYCVKEGKDYDSYSTCKKRCDEIVYSAETTCLEFPSPGLRAVSSSAEEAMCGKKPLFDLTCMENKKKEILEKCKTQCTGTEDCEAQCNDFYNYFTAGVQSPLTNISNSYQKQYKDFPKKKTDDIVLILFFTIFIASLVVYLLKN